MKTIARISNPEEVVVSITISAPLSEWKEFRGQLDESWPSWDVARQITDVLLKITNTVTAEQL
jgi:hypothetical protein